MDSEGNPVEQPYFLVFHSVGQSESIRKAFFVNGYPFQEQNVDLQMWKHYNSKGAFLQIAGKPFPVRQLYAILRYIGTITGSYPQDPYLQAIADEMMETFRIFKEKINHFGEGDTEGYEVVAEFKQMVEEYLNRYNTQFIIMDKLSVVDLELAGLINWAERSTNECIGVDTFRDLLDAQDIQDYVNYHPRVQAGLRCRKQQKYGSIPPNAYGGSEKLMDGDLDEWIKQGVDEYAAPIANRQEKGVNSSFASVEHKGGSPSKAKPSKSKAKVGKSKGGKPSVQKGKPSKKKG